MDVQQIVAESDEDSVREALVFFLQSFTSPAFGALPKAEVELMVLHTLQKLDAIEEDPAVYELVSKLRVTRSKARRLIYDHGLRCSSHADLDRKLKTVLRRPLIQKQGELFVLEVENPLLQDHLRATVKTLGFMSDGSFSPGIVKLGADALTAVLVAQLTAAEQKKVKKILIKAGASDDSVAGLLKGALKQLAGKFAAEAGEQLVERAEAFISPLLDGMLDTLAEQAEALYP